MTSSSTGAYAAERASALSGVPVSTVYEWAKCGILVPSVSATKVRLWSYSDLMGLRVIAWLRQTKTSETGAAIPPAAMTLVRTGLMKLRALGEPLWQPDGASLWVDGDGDVYLKGPAGPERARDGQTVLRDFVNLTAPFRTREGLEGPDLVRPRPALRIVPGKLSGAPHIEGTRLETHAIYALARDGYAVDAIHGFYPAVTVEQIEQALDLETQLEKNLRDAA